MTLKAARVNAKKTVAVSAVAAGVSVRTLQSWEAGKTLPNVMQFFCLCRFYDTNPNDIQFSA